jgi:predicted ABC-class ATPase
MEKQPKRFSEFARENMPLEGSKLKLDEVVNREITVTDYRIKDSRYKKESAPRCLTLQFKLEEKVYILFTGSNVLVDQIDKYKAEIPFITTIKKIDKYYTFT